MKKILFLSLLLCFVLGAAKYKPVNVGTFPAGTEIPGPGLIGSGVNDVDTVIVVMSINNDTTSITHSHSEFNYWQSVADTAIDLTAASSGFAFGTIDSANAYAPVTTSNPLCYYRTFVKNGSATAQRWKVNSSGRVVELVYVPWEDIIPANSQILFAHFKRQMEANASYNHLDTLSATLMTNPNDNVWHTSVGLDNGGSFDQSRHARCAWRVQVAGLNTIGYPVDDAGAWDPEWNDRDRHWDIGDYSDWSGVPVGGGNFSHYDEMDQDVTNCVQAAVNGAVNNGIATMMSDAAQAAATQGFFSWQESGLGSDDFSFIVVKYITKPYVAPYPTGKEAAFVMTIDDGRQPYNTDIIDATLRRGHTLSTFIVGKEFVGNTDPDYVVIDSLVVWADKGIDVGSHSVWHHPSTGNLWSGAEIGGLAFYNFDLTGSTVLNEYTDGMWPNALTASSTGWDSLLFDASPEFFYHAADSLDGNRREAHQYFAKTLGCPVSKHTQYVLKAADYHDYDAVRSLGTSPIPDSDGYHFEATLPQWTPTGVESDSAYACGPPNNYIKPRNMALTATNIQVSEMFGGSDTSIVEADLKLLMRDFAQKAKAQKIGAIVTLTHSNKLDDDDQNNPYGGPGVNVEEWGWGMDVLEDEDFWITNVGDLQRWHQGNASPVPTPANYDQPDSFKFRADEAVWYLPDGTGNRFIRGLKRTSEVPPDYPLGLEQFGDPQYQTKTLIVRWNSNAEEDVVGYNMYLDDVAVAYHGSNPLDDSGIDWEYHVYTGLTEDTQYEIKLNAVDIDGNVSVPCDSLLLTTYPLVINQDLFFKGVSGADYDSLDVFAEDGTYITANDSLVIEVRVLVNKPCNAKLISWYIDEGVDEWHSQDPATTDFAGCPGAADTCDLFSPAFTFDDNDVQDNAWNWQDWHFFDTPIPNPTWAADSSVTITWEHDYTEGLPTPDLLGLEMRVTDANGAGSWVTVSTSIDPADSTDGWDHAVDHDPPPRRGSVEYRMYAIDSESPHIYHEKVYDSDIPFYNQAADVFYRLHADDGTTAVASNQVNILVIATDYDFLTDVDSPVMSFPAAPDYGNAFWDTTTAGSDSVYMNIMFSTDEPALARMWWSPHDSAGTDWITAGSGDWWSSQKSPPDSTYRHIFNYKEHMGYSTATMPDYTLNIQVKDQAGNVVIKDDPNVTSWQAIFYDFRRQKPGLGRFIISNGSTGWIANEYSGYPDTVINVDNDIGTIDMRVPNNENTTVSWGTWQDNGTDVPPLGSYYARNNSAALGEKPWGLSFSEGGNELRAYTFFDFGPSTVLPSDDVEEAYLILNKGALVGYDKGIANMDTLYVWDCTGGAVYREYIGDSHDASYKNADQSAATAWSVAVADWPDSLEGAPADPTVNANFMGLATIVPIVGEENQHVLEAANTELKIDITDLVINQQTTGNRLMYYISFISSGYGAYAVFHDNGELSGDSNTVPRLEVMVNE